ncbi:MAG: O-antigen ligase family protein [Acidobacteria bacterium]|nr:O-antigen ligase family protein [Acidobacteriota bacterium]
MTVGTRLTVYKQSTTIANRAAFVILCALIVFTTLAYGAVHQPVIAVFYLFTIVAAIILIADGWISESLRLSGNLLQLALAAAAVYGLIQVIPFGYFTDGGVAEIARTISLDPFATRVSALHFFVLFVFFAAISSLVRSASRLRTLVNLVIIFGFLYAFYAILQSVLSPQKIYGIYESRFAAPFGSFVNRHNFAAYMEMAIALPLGLLFTGAIQKDKRLLVITAAGLMGVALLLSGSRGGLIALFAELVAFVFLTASNKGWTSVAVKLGLSILLFAVLIGGTIFVGGETSLSRIAETASGNNVTTGRSQIWKQTLDVIAANFPLGAGLGAFGVAYTSHDELSGLERVEQAHNDYLQVAADAGLPGILIGLFFLFFLTIQINSIANIKNTFRRGAAVGAATGLVAILVHSLFDFVLHTTAVSVLFIVLLTILYASRERYDDDEVGTMERSRAQRRRGKVSSFSQPVRTGELS